MRLLPLLSLCSTAAFALQAHADNEKLIECSAYYQILSVAGDQPDISRPQASRAFYQLLEKAGYNPENQEAVAQQMVVLAKEIPGRISQEDIGPFRQKHDSECRALL
ncbi:hypothetical protein ACK3BK_15610 [Pseudomonas sp. L7]|uniref:hypothetical protein n=1 Tax=Pseudomonas TaxID=286 RepID=UPI0039856894